jgi:hypothetical protein
LTLAVPGAVTRPGAGFAAETMLLLTLGALFVMSVTEGIGRQADDADDSSDTRQVARPNDDRPLLTPATLGEVVSTAPVREPVGVRAEPSDPAQR